jgi:hypothetical protein
METTDDAAAASSAGSANNIETPAVATSAGEFSSNDEGYRRLIVGDALENYDGIVGDVE